MFCSSLLKTKVAPAMVSTLIQTCSFASTQLREVTFCSFCSPAPRTDWLISHFSVLRPFSVSGPSSLHVAPAGTTVGQGDSSALTPEIPAKLTPKFAHAMARSHWRNLHLALPTHM